MAAAAMLLCRQHPHASPAVPHPAPPTAQDDLEMEVDSYLRRKFEGALKDVEVVQKEDLDLVGWVAS
jgi:hypothetical protein